MTMYCKSCKAVLITTKEKLTGTCNSCALEAHKGFEMMSKGKFKAGLKKVLDVRFARDNRTEQEIITLKLRKAIAKKEKKIRKKLQKKGLTEQEIEEGLKKFKEV